MSLFNRLRSILSWTVRRSRAEARLDEEIETFLDMSAADKMRDGVPPEEARRLARLELGGAEQVKEAVRTYRHGALLDECGRDLRYALRMFARNPAFTAVILLTLALGIGANTAIFSLIDALMLRSLPVSKPHELVQVNLRERGAAGPGGESFSHAIVRALDQQRDIFTGVAGFSSINFNVGTPGSQQRVHGALVTGSYYRTLGLEPVAGRLLGPQDDEPGAPLAAVLSYRYWKRQYEGSHAAIGQTIAANGVTLTIVGVSPRGFLGTDATAFADITAAVSAMPQLYPSFASLLGPGNFWLRVLARPAAGALPSAAASRLTAVWPGIADQVIAPHWPAPRRTAMAESVFVFEPGATGWSGLRETYDQPLYVLMAVAGLVLLTACANVASLFLARATARQREIAVRLAIGAGRRRIVRQLVIEGLVLSSAGAALGVAVAWALARFLVDLISTGPFQIEFDLTPNGNVLLFSGGLAIVTGLVFGLAPALRTKQSGPLLALTQDTRTSTMRSRLLPSLVTLQVALSLVLVAVAGLLVRTLMNLQQLDPGFSSERVLVVGVDRGSTPREARIEETLLETVRSIPGVTAVSLATHTPLDGSAWTEAVAPAGKPVPETDNTRMLAIGPQYFQTLGIPLVQGRAFNDFDRMDGAAVAIVSERFAEREFPNENPIGRRIAATLMGKPSNMEIVGIAKNVKFGGLRRQPPATVYIPYAQFGGDLPPSLAIRGEGPEAGLREAIRAALQPRLPAAPVEVRALDTQVNATLVRERLMASLAGGFGVLALILSSVGLYGLLAYTVAQRSREIGIRMALGAQASSVVARVLMNGVRLVALGVIVGLPGAWAASRSIESMLFGLTPSDPAVIGSAILLLVAAALLASFLPARRAARVDPLIALRHE